MLFFVRIESILSYEFEILFWENEILESFFEIDRVLTPLGEEEVFLTIIHDDVFDVFTGNPRIKGKKRSFFPIIRHKRLDDLHAHRTNKNIIIDRKIFERLPEFFMAKSFESAELTHVTDECDGFSSFFLSKAHEHFHSSNDRLKTTIIGPIDDETVVDSSEDIPSRMREVNMSQVRDDIEWYYAGFFRS